VVGGVELTSGVTVVEGVTAAVVVLVSAAAEPTGVATVVGSRVAKGSGGVGPAVVALGGSGNSIAVPDGIAVGVGVGVCSGR